MPRLNAGHWMLLAVLAAWTVGLIHWRSAPGAFWRGYLPACLFWAWIPLGSLALIMLHHLTGGAWGNQLRLPLHAAAGTLPLTALLFVPLGAGLSALYPWAAPAWAVADTPTWRSAYLEPGLFLAREAVVFLAAIGCAAGLGVWRAGPPVAAVALRRSALGMLVYGLAVSAFAVDWIMSLTPRWTSANIGFLTLASLCVAALGFALLAAGQPPATAVGTGFRETRADVGNLLLTGILLWAYLEFQQYLTVWSENLPDKAGWYLARGSHGWAGVVWVVALCYAAIPFLLLLSHRVKRHRLALRFVAGLTLAGNLAYVYWLVAPSYYATPGDFSIEDLAPLIGVGGVWLAGFIGSLRRYRRRDEGIANG